MGTEWYHSSMEPPSKGNVLATCEIRDRVTVALMELYKTSACAQMAICSESVYDEAATITLLKDSLQPSKISIGSQRPFVYEPISLLRPCSIQRCRKRRSSRAVYLI